jgi:hypothetical protein
MDYSKDHVYYELVTFFQMSAALKRREYFSDLVHNALLESFVIHLRNLIDFFFEPAAAKRTDILAEYFLLDPGCLGKISAALINARTRANKEVGHLTTDRHPETSPKKVWPVEALAREILRLAQKFAAGADRQKLDDSVVRLIAALAGTRL